jgi:peroxiredoxin
MTGAAIDGCARFLLRKAGTLTRTGGYIGGTRHRIDRSRVIQLVAPRPDVQFGVPRRNDRIRSTTPNHANQEHSMRRTLLLSSLLVAAVALPTRTHAQPSVLLGPTDGRDMQPTEIARVAMGSRAPDFTLTKFGGGTTTLSAFRGRKNVVLVFYRGSWCPFCIRQLTEMRQLLDSELKKSTELLVVSIDGDAQTRQAVARIAADGTAPDFTFLSDADHAVIARYGILNPSGTTRGIPHPATYVIDMDGMVRWRNVETDYRIRPTNTAILTAVRALPAAMMKK